MTRKAVYKDVPKPVPELVMRRSSNNRRLCNGCSRLGPLSDEGKCGVISQLSRQKAYAFAGIAPTYVEQDSLLWIAAVIIHSKVLDPR